MFQTGQEVIQYIENRKGIKSDFLHVQTLFAKYMNFQHSLCVIHVAGTDGKGSTTNYLRSILQEAGYKVGTFTSPYLEVHNDRIRINNDFISDFELVRLANQFYDDFQEGHYSFFEIDTFIALRYFYEHQVDVAVVEVGMGGRLDATNVVTPCLSIITNIGMDHMMYLGNTIEAIAAEKAGIIKPSIPCVIGYDMHPDALSVMEAASARNHAPLYQSNIPSSYTVLDNSIAFELDGQSYEIQGNALYQLKNASLAITACRYLLKKRRIRVPQEAITEGIRNTFWKGRFEKVFDHPLTYLDGAHNTHGMGALVETLQMMQQKGLKLNIIFSAVNDKDTDEMIKQLLSLNAPIWVSEFPFYRAKSAKLIADHYPVTVSIPWQDCVNERLMSVQEGEALIITGSLYFITFVREHLLDLKKRGIYE